MASLLRSLTSTSAHSVPVRILLAAIVGACVPAMSACDSATGATSPPRTSADSSAHAVPKSSQFTFKTIDDPDGPPTEIFGINNLNKLCGFYGNPDVGFVVRPPYKSTGFLKEVYPGATDTVITSLNNTNTIAGWYVTSTGGIFGTTEWEGIWTKYQDPHLLGSKVQYTKLLGISDDDLAVGYYQDSEKVDHGFELDLAIGTFKGIVPPGAKTSAATGINGKGDIVGWVTLSSGVTEGWLLKGGIFTEFSYPGAAQTTPAGIDWSDDIAGSYKDSSGGTHGFVLTDLLASPDWTKIDDPDASGGATVVTGINNHHAVVGYYKNSSGNANGFMADPNL